jgi:hypothetical protein
MNTESEDPMILGGMRSQETQKMRLKARVNDTMQMLKNKRIRVPKKIVSSKFDTCTSPFTDFQPDYSLLSS